MAEIKLKHKVGEHWPQTVMYFYEGSAKVENGVVTLPLDRPHWIQRAWRSGFTLDPETGLEIGFADILMILSGATPEPVHEHTPVVDVSDPEHVQVRCADCSEVLDIDPETVEQSAESAEENTDDEGADGGRQPAGDDGVRTGPEEGADGVPAEGLDGGLGDGTAVRGEGD